MTNPVDSEKSQRRGALTALLVLLAVAVVVYASVMFKIIKFGA